MLWEMYQQGRIQDASATASRAASQAQSVDFRIRDLEDKVDSLALTCQAMWELVRERTSLTEDELIAKVSEIDVRDGKVDGKMGGGIAPCPKCGRVLNKRHARCIYCGEEADKDHAFER